MFNPSTISGRTARRMPSLIAFAIMANALHAQVANYNFSQTSGTYVPVAGGTLLFNNNFDDAVFGPITVPAFMYDGGTYTQIWVSTNGFLTFGSAPTATNYTPLSSTQTYAGAVSPFGANLQSGASGATNIRYRSLGYQLIVQWTNVRRAGETESFSFQARLNRWTGVIQFIYGPIVTGPSASESNFPEVGLRGPNNSHANNVKNRRLDPGNHNWHNSVPGNNNASNMRFTSSAPAKYWEPGQTYRYRRPGGGMGCEPPFVVVTVNTDCANSTFTITADVETIGDANNITVSTVPAGGVYANVGDGIYALGPYAFGTIVTLNVVNNSDANCGEQVTNITNATCDCLGVPDGAALPGTPCDDGQACTVNDTWTGLCACVGTIQDSDGDGVCDADDSCPNEPGGVGDPCDDNDPLTANDALDAQCECVGDNCTNAIDIIFQSDGISDISWKLFEQGTDVLFQSGGGVYPPSNGYGISTCLPDGCFYLVVTDDLGDGITAGGYILMLGGNKRLIDNRHDAFGNGGFTSGGTSQIAGGEGFCLPIGTDRLIFNSCDKLDYRTSPCQGEYVVANDNPLVTAQYGVTNTTSGYQMWWYEPNGGYSFKRIQYHSTLNGLAAGPTRACHFRINAWSGNALVQGTVYNVKVRGVIDNTYPFNWGPACRMMVNNTAAQCPQTRLNNIPGNPFFSCGATVAVSSNVNVHAITTRRMQPNCTWLNANRYQFRFRIPAEFVNIIKTSNTYFVNTVGLTCGKTYEVDVRASFDGGATWCYTGPLWGDICLLTMANCFTENSQQRGLVEAEPDARLRMYPNPNRGDQLFLSMEQLEAGVRMVSVDIFDAYGKRAAARTIAVTDEGFINTVLELNGSLAPGLYLVNINAGEKVYTERLVIQP